MGKRLYVGNLAYSVNDAELQQLFEQHGLGFAGTQAKLESVGQHLDELPARQRRIIQADATDVATDLGIERRPEQRGLPRSCLPDEDGDPLGG